MKSLKIAFSILLCVTILSVSASVVCAVIAGNVADSFRDYRSSVACMLSSLYAQLNESKQAFANALTYKDAQTEQDTTQAQTEPATTPAELPTEAPTQDDADADVKIAYTLKTLDGRIGVFDAQGTLLRTVNVAVSTLPRTDREQLAVGIAVYSEQELGALIEDFSG